MELQLSPTFRTTDGKYMRTQYVKSVDKVAVEYYDNNFGITARKEISLEYPIFGGVYSDGDYNYILTGQKNPEENNECVVYAITKYDSTWKKIATATLKGADTYIPFDAGSARFAMSGKYLLIRTCHEMYESGDGYHHQANVTIEIDTDTMKVTDSYYNVMNVNYGYVRHSFNQFLLTDGR